MERVGCTYSAEGDIDSAENGIDSREAFSQVSTCCKVKTKYVSMEGCAQYPDRSGKCMEVLISIAPALRGVPHHLFQSSQRWMVARIDCTYCANGSVDIA